MVATPVGSSLGPYTLLEEIGCGGTSRVYRAYNSEAGREVAVKVLTVGSPHLDEMVRRFQREIQTATQLDHPHILPILDYGADGDTLYLVMPFVPNGTLVDLLQASSALTPYQVAQIASQIGAALDYAHQAGMIHRDVKPHNIMVLEAGQVALTDFGLVKPGGNWTRLTFTGIVLGSPAYMSPEQALDAPLDHRADVYSLGVVLYECLLGQKPFNGRNPVEMVSQHVATPPPRPSDLAPGMPAALEAALLRALAKHPEDRFASAGQLAEAIQAAVEAMPPHMRHQPVVGPVESMTAPDAAAADINFTARLEPDPTPEQRLEAYEQAEPEPHERRRVLLPIVLIILAACVGMSVMVEAVARSTVERSAGDAQPEMQAAPPTGQSGEGNASADSGLHAAAPVGSIGDRGPASRQPVSDAPAAHNPANQGPVVAQPSAPGEPVAQPTPTVATTGGIPQPSQAVVTPVYGEVPDIAATSVPPDGIGGAIPNQDAPDQPAHQPAGESPSSGGAGGGSTGGSAGADTAPDTSSGGSGGGGGDRDHDNHDDDDNQDENHDDDD